ncbi:MAG: hypothetical protein ACM3WP_10175 [Acidobacteriota bacterium]
MLQAVVLTVFLSVASVLAGVAQDADSPNKNLDVRSPIGDLHVGADGGAKKIGVPLYPGARLKSHDPNADQANLSVLTEAFGMKLVVANYVSDDDPSKIVAFYRNKLKKYGKVLECHSDKHGGDVSVEDDKHADKELKCEQESGPVTELKVGSEENQHLVAVEALEGGRGSEFALVYVHTRGKMGDI